MSRAAIAIGFLALLLPARTARAEAVVRLEMAAGLPFSQQELVSAVRLRLRLEEPAARRPDAVLVVVSSSRRGVVVALPGRGLTRRLWLRGATGTPAARLVALTILDLVPEKVRLPASAPASRPAFRATTRPTSRPLARPPAPSPRPPPRPIGPKPGGPPLLLVGALLSSGAGTNGDRASLAASLETSLRLQTQLRAVLGIGAAFVPPFAVEDKRLTLVALPLRLGLGWFPASGPLELRAHLLAQPYWVTGEGLGHSGWLGAAGAAVFYHLARARRVRFLLGAGVDVFFNRTELLLRGNPALATERAAFWAGLAVAARFGR